MASYTGSDKRLQYLFSRAQQVMTGATSEDDGITGNVPTPLAGDENKFLRGDGTWAEAGGSGGLPGQGYTGSDLILRDAEGNISGVWYIDSGGNWVEYTKGGGSGHTFGMLQPTVATTITNSFSISVE